MTTTFTTHFNILPKAQKIFGLSYVKSLKALVYFGDGDLDILTNNGKETLVNAVKKPA